MRAVGEPVGTDPLPVAGELLDADSNTLHTYQASDFNEAIGFSGTNSLAAGAYYIKVTGTTDMSTAVYTIMVVEDPYRDRLTDRCSGDIVGLSDPLSGCQWHLRNVGQLGDSTGHDLNVTSVWDDYTGEGIRVAIVDDGMDFEHEDLTDNVDATPTTHSLKARPFGISTPGTAHRFPESSPPGTTPSEYEESPREPPSTVTTCCPVKKRT